MPETTTKLEMMQSPEYRFWITVLESAMKCARKLNTTDSEIRKKVDHNLALLNLSIRRMKQFLANHQLTPNSIKELSSDSDLRREYSNMMKKFRNARRGYEYFADILYARLYLKDEGGIVPYFVGLTDDSQVRRRMEQMHRMFPD